MTRIEVIPAEKKQQRGVEVAGHPDIAGRGGTETDGKGKHGGGHLGDRCDVAGTVLLDGLIIIEIHAIWHAATRLDKRLDFLTHEFLGADEPHGIEPPNRKVPFLAFLGAFARFAVWILHLELLVDFKVLIPRKGSHRCGSGCAR